MNTFQVGNVKYCLTPGDLAWWSGKLQKYSQFMLEDIQRKITANADQFAYRVTGLIGVLLHCELGQPNVVCEQRRKFVQLLSQANLFSQKQLQMPIWRNLTMSLQTACTNNNETFAVELYEA